MYLFDNISTELRTEAPPVARSKFDAVNSCNLWNDWSDVRRTCESWFGRIPETNRADLRSRFRSRQDSQHDAAFFELFLHEMFLRLGCHVEMHPEVSGQTPDFRVSQSSKVAYVEATAVGLTSNTIRRNHDEQDAINKLNKLTSPYFCLGVDMEGTLRETLSKGELTEKFEKLLNSHDSTEVQETINQFGPYEAPSETIQRGDWTLTGWLLPASDNAGDEQIDRSIVIEPYRAKSVDPISVVRRTLKAKAEKYKRLDAPLVIAANVLHPYYFPPLECDIDVLWGNRMRYGRQTNGYWLTRSSEVPAAVLRFRHAEMLNMFQAAAFLHVNPKHTSPTIPNALFRLPHNFICKEDIRQSKGEDVARLLGVSWK